VKQLHQTAQNYGVRISIENLYSSDLLADIGELLAFFRELDCDIGLTLDVAHAHLAGNATLFFNALKDRIIHLHVSDNDGVEDRHWDIGEGNIDWKQIAEKTREIKYNGLVIMEGMELVGASVDQLKRFFREG
jgi:sugar phosphate isomerase/epimerase